MGLFKKKKGYDFLLDYSQLKDMVDALYITYNEHPRDIEDVFLYVLLGVNSFCSAYVDKWHSCDKKQLKEVCAPAILTTTEASFEYVNGDRHITISTRLIDYWLGTVNEDEDVLTYIVRCLAASGIVKFACSYNKKPEQKKYYLKLQKTILDTLDSNGTIFDMITCLPEGFFDYINTCSKELVNCYRIECNNEMLDDLFRKCRYDRYD